MAQTRSDVMWKALTLTLIVNAALRLALELCAYRVQQLIQTLGWPALGRAHDAARGIAVVHVGCRSLQLDDAEAVSSGREPLGVYRGGQRCAAQSVMRDATLAGKAAVGERAREAEVARAGNGRWAVARWDEMNGDGSTAVDGDVDVAECGELGENEVARSAVSSRPFLGTAAQAYWASLINTRISNTRRRLHATAW
jgi:hypothetical protein